MEWWVDSAYAFHEDVLGHTGATVSMGSGVVIGMSKKQKINTKSSTECKVVGADDALPQMVWTKYFIEAQLYNVGGNIRQPMT